MDESYPNLMAFPEEAVSLSQIQERKIALEWFEAVAIAQAAWMSADQNGNGLTSRSLVPRDVFIQADGQVNATRKLSGSPSDPYPVQRVARLLRDLLPDVFPMPLRLALTQAMSSPPFYESLKDFSDALTYFERPNRPALIQGVYQRWKHSTPQTAALEVPTSPDAVPVIVRKTRKPLLVKRFVHVGFIVLGAAAVSAAIVWGFNSSGSSPITGANLLQRTTAAVDSVLDRVLPTPAPPREIATESPAPVAVPVPPAPTSVATNDDPIVSPNEIAGLAAQIAAFDLKDRPMGVALPSPVEVLAVAPTAGDTPQTNAQIYSDADAGVVPPVATYPRLPSSLPEGTEPGDLAVIDLIISPGGNVESVKLRSAPTTMADTMILTMSLSAAKTWRFEPASKDGQPVRYRKSVWLVMH